MFDALLDLVFPRRSLRGSVGAFVTEEECRALRPSPVIEEREKLRIQGLSFLNRLSAAGRYLDIPELKEAIHTFKYRRIPGLGNALIRFLASCAFPVAQDAILCPVPLHWTRTFERGFNQAEILARGLAKERGIPVKNLLVRGRPTGHQARRDRIERFASMERAFVASRDIPPAHVILIDDVATTGATLDACARALKERGATFVEAWVVARG